MIFVTGDCHANFERFAQWNFPEQDGMSRDDYVIICGDFGGIWHDNPNERYNLSKLEQMPFTILFVDGNHENFDRLREFSIVNFHGGKAHKIADNIFHLMRGYVFTLCGKKFFVFGGGASHDIQDGILDPAAFENENDFLFEYHKMEREGKMFRVKNYSWWEEEIPNEEEMERGLQTLNEYDHKVNYVITHSAPQTIAEKISKRFSDADKLTLYLDDVSKQLQFDKWFFGHYHTYKIIDQKYVCLYDDLIRIE